MKLKRNLVMLAALGFAVISFLTGCAEKVIAETASVPEKVQTEKTTVLIAYFSRMGNTDYPENVDATSSASIVADGDRRCGTTEYIAHLIRDRTEGKLYFIQTEIPYPADFDEATAQNHQEIADGILPKLKESDLNVSAYDVVFIGYPIWASTIPQAVRSFLQEYDWKGKIVIPFCTHQGYGAGRSYDEIAGAVPEAKVLEGVAIDARQLGQADEQVSEWLQKLELFDK